MPTRVQLPDGSIGEFPDGMSQSDIEGVLQKQYGGPQSSRPAGLPAGQSLPGMPGAPTVAMQPSLLGRDAAHPTIDSRLREVPSSGSDTGGSKTLAALQNFGSHAGGGIIAPALHPLKTGAGILQGAMDGPLTFPKMAAGAYDDFKQNGAGAAIPHLLGDAAGTAIAGELTGGALKRAMPYAGALGEGMQDLAASIRNSKAPPSMREAARDNNPGRGTLEAGIGPTGSRQGMANKVAGATEAVGSRIGDAVTRADQNANAPAITPGQLKPLIDAPIRSQLGVIGGPGGTATAAPYEGLRQSMNLRAPGATSSIYGPNAPDTILPSDLWKTIKNVDANTRFNTDPEVENVNETRRDMRSNLRPILEASDPTIASLSRTYGDLRSAGTALERAQAPFNLPRGMSSLIDTTVNSTPVNSTASYGIFKAGKGLQNLATNAPEWLGGKGGSPATMRFAQKPVAGAPKMLTADAIGNADYGPRSMARGPMDVGPSASPPVLPMRALPENAGGGELQPMVGIRKEQYPPLAEPFAKMRVRPNVFDAPTTIQSNPFAAAPSGNIYGDVPRGLRELPAPPPPKAKKGKG